MAGPDDAMAAGAGGRSHLRASHADREQVIDVLKAAFVQGRLARDELDLRVGQALASRTHADLAALTADLPVLLTGACPPEPAREPVNQKAFAAVTGATAALAGMLTAVLMTPDGTSVALPVPVAVIVFVLLMAVPTGWLLLVCAWLERRASGQSVPVLPPGAGSSAAGFPVRA